MPFEAYRQWESNNGEFQRIAVTYPQITREDWDALFKRLYDADKPAIKKRFTAFMLDRFDAAELAQINAFYASGTGKKLLAAIPEFFSESVNPQIDDSARPLIGEWIQQMTKKYNIQ